MASNTCFKLAKEPLTSALALGCRTYMSCHLGSTVARSKGHSACIHCDEGLEHILDIMVRFKMYRQDDVYMQLAPSSPKLSQSETHATFINITHPAQRKEAATRKQVAQYIGVNFRNRSRPSAWREAKGSPSKSGNRKPASPGQLRARGVPIHYWVVDRDFHGLRSDPFGSYPIDPQEWLPEAVDFCKPFSTCPT